MDTIFSAGTCRLSDRLQLFKSSNVTRNSDFKGRSISAGILQTVNRFERIERFEPTPCPEKSLFPKHMKMTSLNTT